MNISEHDELICELAAARLGGTTVNRAPLIENLNTAYMIQESVYAKLGGQSVGWKIGSTSLAAQKRLGTTEPGAGRLLSDFSYGADATIPVYIDHDVQVEIEFAFVFGDHLYPRTGGYDLHDIRSSIEAFLPGMELVGSRFSGGLANSGREAVTADGGANIAFVSGEPVPFDPAWDFAHQSCGLWINDNKMADGTGCQALV